MADVKQYRQLLPPCVNPIAVNKYIYIRYPSSSEADVEDNCSSKGGNVSLGRCNFIACRNEDHTFRDAEAKLM